MRDVEVLRRRLDAATTGLADAVDRTGAYRVDGHASATSCLKHLGRIPGGEAAGRVKGAAALRRLPLVEKSFVEGRIPTGHIAALGRLGSNPRVAGFFEEADEWFRERACELDHDGFVVLLRQWEMLADADGAEEKSDREHRNRNATVTQGFDGSFRTKANHAAVQGATIEQIFEAFEQAEFEADWADARARLGDDVATKTDLGRTSAQRRADAIYKIFQLAAANPDAATGRPTVNIVIDEETFATELERRAATGVDNVPDHDPTRVDQAVCRTIDGVPLTPGEVVQTAMAGLVRAIIIDAKGNVINHGRAKRLFTGASRRSSSAPRGDPRPGRGPLRVRWLWRLRPAMSDRSSRTRGPGRAHRSRPTATRRAAITTDSRKPASTPARQPTAPGSSTAPTAPRSPTPPEPEPCSQMLRSRPSQNGARRSFLRILPDGLRGSSSVKSTVLGTLKPAIRSRAQAMTSSGVTSSSPLTTMALTASPHLSSGTPITATSATPGQLITAFSTSAG